MSTLKNLSGLTEDEVEDGVVFADAAQYLAGGRAGEGSREMAREVLRGSISAEDAVASRLAEITADGQ